MFQYLYSCLIVSPLYIFSCQNFVKSFRIRAIMPSSLVVLSGSSPYKEVQRWFLLSVFNFISNVCTVCDQSIFIDLVHIAVWTLKLENQALKNLFFPKRGRFPSFVLALHRSPNYVLALEHNIADLFNLLFSDLSLAFFFLTPSELRFLESFNSHVIIFIFPTLNLVLLVRFCDWAKSFYKTDDNELWLKKKERKKNLC